MRNQQIPTSRPWRSVRGAARPLMTVLLAALGPATVLAEPTASDVARDVADLAGRVDDLELLRNVVLGLLGASVLGLPALWWRLGKRISRVADELQKFQAAREKG